MRWGGASVFLLSSLVVAQEVCGTQGAALSPAAWSGRSWPWSLSASPVRERSTSASVYARREGMIRVLGELYLLARCDRHRRSRETWSACAELAERMGCPPGFCLVMREMAREDLSARRRAELKLVLAGECQDAGIDEVNLRYWVELLALPPQSIRAAMESLPLGNLFWRQSVEEDPEQKLAPFPRSGEMAGKLLGVMAGQLVALRSVTDLATAEDAAREMLLLLLQLQTLREECARCGTTLAGVSFDPQQAQLYESLRQGIRQEWERLRTAGYFDSASLIATEALLGTS